MPGFCFGSGRVVNGVDVSDTTLTPQKALPGYEFYDASGEKREGTMPVKDASILIPSSIVDGVINAGQYIGGKQILPKEPNFLPSNIRKNVKMWDKTGTFGWKYYTVSGAVVSGGTITVTKTVEEGFIGYGLTLFPSDAVSLTTNRIISASLMGDIALAQNAILTGAYLNSSRYFAPGNMATITTYSLSGTTLTIKLTPVSPASFGGTGKTYTFYICGVA